MPPPPPGGRYTPCLEGRPQILPPRGHPVPKGSLARSLQDHGIVSLNLNSESGAGSEMGKMGRLNGGGAKNTEFLQIIVLFSQKPPKLTVFLATRV